MRATETRVNALVGSRGERQRAAAGLLACVFPARCPTPFPASWPVKSPAPKGEWRPQGEREGEHRGESQLFRGVHLAVHPTKRKGRFLMPLIEREKKPELVPLRIKLEREQHDRLVRYAQFLESSIDHIIAQTLDFVIRKDKEFAALEARSAAKQNASARVKHSQGREDKE
jgi:hypothetical protein